MAWLKYEDVLFNVELNAEKTLTEFSEHEKHHGFSKEQLKEAHDLIKKSVKKKPVKSEE